ncbi:MAG TPA: VWA domain-containing protein [Myxococcota bacterium]|nr:VWA domain-containing protein [Myxococcota bacterium]HRY94294.1 VWA domain-containing protein [Myxococcota bacterium]
MRFAAAEYFYWLWVLPLVVAGGVVALRRRWRAGRAAISPETIGRLVPERSLEREILRFTLLVLSLTMIIVALARPQFGTHSTLVKRRGVDVVVALDTSKSMLARDVTTTRGINRLKRARMEVSGLIDKLQGDRIGLVAFSGAAFVQCPLTSDYAAAKLFLRAMEPGAIPLGGTNIAEALQAARQMFEGSKGGSRSRVLVLISDGEDHAGGYEQEVDALQKLGVVIHAVGIGTQIGELIPEEDGRYMRFEGKTVMTRLAEGTLRALADATGGVYVHSAAGDLGFEAVLEELSRMQKSDYEARIETVYEEKFQLFAFIGLLCLLAATLVPARRVVRGEGGLSS